MFPDRKKKSVIDCAMRVMIKDHESVNPWTEEQLKDLQRLVEEKGRKWSEIGREVNHSGEQCRSKFRVEYELQDMRKKSGHFEPEEDHSLELEIRALKNEHSAPPEDIDVKNLPWKQISAKMGGERTAADYARRWQRLRTIFLSKANGSDSPKKDADRRRKGALKGEAVDDENRKLVEALEKLVHTDSERGDVVWVGIERALEFPYGAAARRFNLLVSKFEVGELSFFEQVREISIQLNNGAIGGGSGLAKPRAAPKRKAEEEEEEEITAITSATTIISSVADDNDSDGDLINLPKPKKSKKNKNKNKHKVEI
jgi:hypothetical protein